MALSPGGVIADILWHEIPNREPSVELGRFVVMPNHIHGILITSSPQSAISPKPHTVSTIIRSYKSVVTKHANRLGLENGWQARFHDHIIRNDMEFQRISHYIANNPANWNTDTFK